MPFPRCSGARPTGALHNRKLEPMKRHLMAATAALVLLSSCGPGSLIDSRSPDIRGSIEAIIPASANKEGVVAVVRINGAKEADTQYDKADVTLTSSTTIARRTPDGDARIGLDSLKVGQVVEVRFTGPVAESYPVKSKAAWIAVIAEKKR